MKTALKAIALSLVVIMSVLMLVSCSSYGGIKKAFEKEGWELVEDSETTKTIKTDDGELTVTVHVFKQKSESGLGGLVSGLLSATVWEFSSDKDLQKALDSNDEIKALLKDASESDLVNGNCVLMTINPKAVEIFASTK